MVISWGSPFRNLRGIPCSCARISARATTRENIEKLKGGLACPERDMIKDLEKEQMIHQTDGKYFLAGYENGPPNTGDQVRISSRHLSDYLSWGWKFKAKVDDKHVIVEYTPALPWQREEILRGGCNDDDDTENGL